MPYEATAYEFRPPELVTIDHPASPDSGYIQFETGAMSFTLTIDGYPEGQIDIGKIRVYMPYTEDEAEQIRYLTEAIMLRLERRA